MPLVTARAARTIRFIREFYGGNCARATRYEAKLEVRTRPVRWRPMTSDVPIIG
jgi:hypothetical protein